MYIHIQRFITWVSVSDILRNIPEKWHWIILHSLEEEQWEASEKIQKGRGDKERRNTQWWSEDINAWWMNFQWQTRAIWATN